MRLTIIKPDDIVGVDGVFRKIDCSSLPVNLHALQWNTDRGHIEWIGEVNTEIDNITPYQHMILAWQQVGG